MQGQDVFVFAETNVHLLHLTNLGIKHFHRKGDH
jgi:hypothetical protein